jgi:hypothetical protein
MSQLRHTLDEVQRWMQAVITHPAGPATAIVSREAIQQIAVDPAQLETVIARSQALTSLERLEIYYRAYYARLLDCLREEYSVLAWALGAELFNSFAVAYLQEHRSQSYTLGRLGTQFPEFLAATRPVPDSQNGDAANADWPAFMIDLARLERVVNAVFDGPGVEGLPALDAANLRDIPPEHWPTARLVPASCLRLLKLQFPINDYFTAAARQEAAPLPQPGDAYLAVTRRDYRVKRFELSRAQFELLQALIDRETIGAAIELAAQSSTVSDDKFAIHLREWFRQWTAESFFIGIEEGPALAARPM